MSVQWKILVWEPDGTPRNDVTVADAVFSLESFSVSPAGSCQEANWMMLPSAVNVRARDIIQLQTSAGGAWTPRFKGTVVMAGNPRSSEVQSYRAVGLKQRFYERVCTQARVPGGDVATGMAANAYLGLPTLVGVNPGLNAPAVTFQLGDRFPALESYGELFDALAATVGQFIVPAGTSYVYDGVTYTAGQTVPAVEWGVDATGQAFFRRPHAAAVNVSEVDTNARVEWVPTNAENVVDAPVLVYASGMVDAGWRRGEYHQGGEPPMGANPTVWTQPMPVQPLYVTPIAATASSTQALVMIDGALDHMTLHSSWTLMAQAGMSNNANAYDNNLTTYATGDSSTFEARVVVRSGNLGVPAEGIVRVRYQPTYPVASYFPGDAWRPRLIMEARSPGPVNVGVAYARAEYELPVPAGIPSVMDVYYPFLLPAVMTAADRAAATEIRVGVWMYQESGSVTYAPRLYNIMFYSVNAAAAARLATSFSRAAASDPAQVTLYGSFGAVTQTMNLTPATGSALTVPIERVEYGVTVDEGAFTRYHVQQAYDADLMAQRVVLEQLARRATTGGLR